MPSLPSIVFLNVDPRFRFNAYQLADELSKRAPRDQPFFASFGGPVREAVQRLLAPLFVPPMPSPVRPQDEVALHWTEQIPGVTYSPDWVFDRLVKSLPPEVLAALLMNNLNSVVGVSSTGRAAPTDDWTSFVLDATPELVTATLTARPSAPRPDDCLYVELRTAGDPPVPARPALSCREVVLAVAPTCDLDLAVKRILDFQAPD